VHPDSLATRVVNVSGKQIVGLTFYLALADSTEHWEWLHWDYDQTRKLREFGWSKVIDPGAKKTLYWDNAYFNHEHGGGGVLVLTNVLYADGSRWDEAADQDTCRAGWYNSHKKSGFVRPIELPVRN
jgi:hypothetical protein